MTDNTLVRETLVEATDQVLFELTGFRQLKAAPLARATGMTKTRRYQPDSRSFETASKAIGRFRARLSKGPKNIRPGVKPAKL